MSFLHPAAFAGLASILVLILLSLWRQRPARVVVPSVRLWERIPDRLPPVRSLSRPRVSLSLLLQMLVAAALVFAMAGPGMIRSHPAPRRIAVVVDLSASMGPRMDEVGKELAKLDAGDEITLIDTASLARRRGLGGLSDLRPVNRMTDPAPALDLAASDAKHVVFVTDRATSWTPPSGVTLHPVLVGGPLRNTGIVGAGVADGRLHLRLTGPSEIEVTIDGAPRRLASGAFHLVDVPAGASRIQAALPADDFPADDRVEFERSTARIEVGFEGRPDAAIQAAIESNPGARIVRGGAPQLLIRIGAAEGKGRAPWIVDVDPVEGVEQRAAPGRVSVADHPLMRGVKPDELRFLEVGSLAGPVEAALVYSDGVPIAAVRRRGEIVIAARYADSGWPAFPSFPIFWANVLDYSASGLGAWRANGLLDEAASPGQDRKPFDPRALESRPLVPLRSDLTGGAVAAAALLLALLWIVERAARSE